MSKRFNTQRPFIARHYVILGQIQTALKKWNAWSEDMTVPVPFCRLHQKASGPLHMHASTASINGKHQLHHHYSTLSLHCHYIVTTLSPQCHHSVTTLSPHPLMNKERKWCGHWNKGFSSSVGVKIIRNSSQMCRGAVGS
jgi:hypothetical protein